MTGTSAAHSAPSSAGAAPRLPYADLDAPAAMRADCREAGRALGLLGRPRASRRERELQRAARSAVAPAPSIRFEDYPREVTKRGIGVSDAAQRLANAIFD